MTTEQLAEIRAALDAATPGPWQMIQSSLRGRVIVRAENHDQNVVTGNTGYTVATREDDLHVIANAPAWLRLLLAEVERLTIEERKQRDLAALYVKDWMEAKHEFLATENKIREAHREEVAKRDGLLRKMVEQHHEYMRLRCRQEGYSDEGVDPCPCSLCADAREVIG